MKKLYTDHGTTENEMQWVGNQVNGIYLVVEADVAWEKSELPALKKSLKEREDALAANKARLAEMDAALKSGKRALTSSTGLRMSPACTTSARAMPSSSSVARKP